MRRINTFRVVLSILMAFSLLRADDDILMKAMRDEMTRSIEKLQLEKLEKPYFIAYQVQERTATSASATFASLLSSVKNHTRQLFVEVRVGDYKLDNTNFFSYSFGRSGVVQMYGGTVQLPLEDDYDELRRQIWLASDGMYKKALEDLSKKRAMLQNKKRTEEVPDFSKEEPATVIDISAPVEMNLADAETLVRDLSGLFKEMPDIFTSTVNIDINNVYTHYVNSEGTSFTRMSPSMTFKALAGTQAPDGMSLEDFVTVYGRSTDDLPPKPELAERIREMGARLQKLRAAPLIERYIGPVLFESQAVAELFSQGFIPNLLASRRVLSDNPWFERYDPQEDKAFLDRIGARVLPKFMSIVDNPTLSQYNKMQLIGGYKVDDDGVPAREKKLVENGMLKTLLMTRTPVRGILQSTGNRRGSGAVPTNLIVTAEGGLKDQQIKKEFLNMIKQQGKEFGIVIRRLGNPLLKVSPDQMASMSASMGTEETKIENILLAYKVFTDGHEELIRNAKLSGISTATFKEIIAASNRQTVYNFSFLPQRTSPFSMGPRTNVIVSLVVPSQILFEDMILKRPSGEIPNPPMSRHPFFEK